MAIDFRSVSGRDKRSPSLLLSPDGGKEPRLVCYSGESRSSSAAAAAAVAAALAALGGGRRERAPTCLAKQVAGAEQRGCRRRRE